MNTLELAGGSASRAAQILGISVGKVQYKVKQTEALDAPTT